MRNIEKKKIEILQTSAKSPIWTTKVDTCDSVACIYHCRWKLILSYVQVYVLWHYLNLNKKINFILTVMGLELLQFRMALVNYCCNWYSYDLNKFVLTIKFASILLKTCLEILDV